MGELAGGMSFVFLGKAAVLVSLGSETFLLDPGRGLDLQGGEIPPASDLSAVIITHEHSDHFDRELVSRLAADGVTVLGSRYVISWISTARSLGKGGNLLIMRHGKSIEVGEAKIMPLRARHTGLGPFVVEVRSEGGSFFHGSDSGLPLGLGLLSSRVRVAFLPVGGGSHTASVSEAIRTARILAPKWVVPIHGTEREVSSFVRKASRILEGTEVLVPEVGKVFHISE